MNTPKLIPTTLALFALASPALAQGYVVDELDGRWRLTWENLDGGAAGESSVVGVHYEVFGLLDTSGLFAGVGAYGSVHGDLGNFFAGGIDLGWRQKLTETFSIQIGTFAGSTSGTLLQGEDGLAWRPFVALEQNFSRFGLRAEVAQMNLPGGDFDETVFAVGVTLPMNWLSARERSDWASPIDLSALDWERVSIGATALNLNPSSGSKRLDGSTYDDDVVLGGLRARVELGEHSYMPFEAWGAVGGGASGFRALLGGYGLRGPLWSSALPGALDWEVELLAGVGGGGEVDVGGGLLFKALGGLRARLAENWTATAGWSYVDAQDGNFSGAGLQFGVAWDPRSLRLSGDYERDALAGQMLPKGEGWLDVWEFSTNAKAYAMRAGSTPKSGGSFDGRQYLAGVGAERHLSDTVSLVARAFGPVGGEIGGYGELLSGVRFQGTPLDFMDPVDVYVEYDIGAAGGGDVAAGSGLVHQISGGLAVDLTDGLELALGIGRMNAMGSGSFDASVVELGLAFDMTRILARR